MTVKAVTYHALEPGTTLAVLGAVHGNERCGAEAINRVIADLDRGSVSLKRGTLQLMPIANPKAYAEGVRFTERNLNRYLFPKEIKSCYEDYLDPIVCGFLDKADAVLDLHSYTSQGDAFIFLGGANSDENKFARALGVGDFVHGWAEALGQGGGKGGDKESQGTTEYARSKGALAVTLECGQHQNVEAPDVGYRAILLALRHFQMLDEGRPAALSLKESAGAAPTAQRCVRMKNVYYCEQGASFAKPWRHFDFVAKGEPMALLSSGALTAPEDGYIVLPKAVATIGEEWFYFGAPTSFPG
ncbi:MAG TPA: succinylglutamate desuccinylase/aspartoacylase family protein [Burkholderiales bacterium]|nr:succinylglutamate desuccinylase/aspartoacylase family protein [Burkholderiales bacterium]